MNKKKIDPKLKQKRSSPRDYSYKTTCLFCDFVIVEEHRPDRLYGFDHACSKMKKELAVVKGYLEKENPFKNEDQKQVIYQLCISQYLETIKIPKLKENKK